ncbi:aminoglycoside phosphotransferase family protein [Phenylobacterium sp.]|jgi:hypothetical protein|uniref:aminoglycoside phosphotransferase family protein n=1 Tax=Phenylobacterium sp. TaxID=1871053 RepID=UPI002F410A7D
MKDDRLVGFLKIARRLAVDAGRPPPQALEPLSGGRNNRVFLVRADDASHFVLKVYHSDPRDPRDRLAHEWGFLVHVRGQGVLSAPEPLAFDPGAHAALYSYAPGRKLSADEIEPRHVDAALDFVRRINVPGTIAHLPEGSEACFSLAQHLTTVERRINRLGNLDPAAPAQVAARAFVQEDLWPSWAVVRRRIEQDAERLGMSLDAPPAPGTVIASPSDFGFHNALVDGDAVTFIDFEYAGRDDPAKLACDFFCCPEVPPPITEFDRFVNGLVTGDDAARCRLLLDAYRLKWACIVLNDFLPLGADRRAFADQRRTAERCEAQLARARSIVDLVETQP